MCEHGIEHYFDNGCCVCLDIEVLKSYVDGTAQYAPWNAGDPAAEEREIVSVIRDLKRRLRLPSGVEWQRNEWETYGYCPLDEAAELERMAAYHDS